MPFGHHVKRAIEEKERKLREKIRSERKYYNERKCFYCILSGRFFVRMPNGKVIFLCYLHHKQMKANNANY